MKALVARIDAAVLGLLLTVLLSGCAHIRRWYDAEWQRDGICLDWCAIELQIAPAYVLATRNPPGGQKSCECMIMSAWPGTM